MREEVSKATFATHYIDEELSLLEQHWTNETGNMSEDDFKTEMFNYLAFVEEYITEKALINTKFFNFSIHSELQIWVDKNISNKANKIVKKIAFILPEDMFAEISIQQTMNEKEGAKYEKIKYFSTIEQARDWLLN